MNRIEVDRKERREGDKEEKNWIDLYGRGSNNVQAVRKYPEKEGGRGTREKESGREVRHSRVAS